MRNRGFEPLCAARGIEEPNCLDWIIINRVLHKALKGFNTASPIISRKDLISKENIYYLRNRGFEPLCVARGIDLLNSSKTLVKNRNI